MLRACARTDCYSSRRDQRHCSQPTASPGWQRFEVHNPFGLSTLRDFSFVTFDELTAEDFFRHAVTSVVQPHSIWDIKPWKFCSGGLKTEKRRSAVKGSAYRPRSWFASPLIFPFLLSQRGTTQRDERAFGPQGVPHWFLVSTLSEVELSPNCVRDLFCPAEHTQLQPKFAPLARRKHLQCTAITFCPPAQGAASLQARDREQNDLHRSSSIERIREIHRIAPSR
jgi:hypothetical protein